MSAAGGKATLSVDGSYAAKPDVAIVVFGEDPYAEFVGDRPRALEYSPADKKDLELLLRLEGGDSGGFAVHLRPSDVGKPGAECVRCVRRGIPPGRRRRR